MADDDGGTDVIGWLGDLLFGADPYDTSSSFSGSSSSWNSEASSFGEGGRKGHTRRAPSGDSYFSSQKRSGVRAHDRVSPRTRHARKDAREHRRAAADPSLHPAAAYRADRHAASRLWGRRMRLLLLWKLAAAALWTTAVAGLCLCLWLGLTAQNIASVIVWLVFVVSLGYIDLSTVTPFAALFATQAAPSSAIASTSSWLGMLMSPALVLAFLAAAGPLTVWNLQRVASLQRAVFAPGVTLLRALCLPRFVTFVATQSLLGTILVHATVHLLPGQPVLVSCGIPGSASTLGRMCADATAVSVLGFAPWLGVISAWHHLRTESNVLSFPSLNLDRVPRLKQRVPGAIVSAARLIAVCCLLALLHRALLGTIADAFIAGWFSYWLGSDVMIVSDALPTSAPLPAAVSVALQVPRLARALGLALLVFRLAVGVLEVMLTEAINFEVVAAGVPGATQGVNGYQPTAMAVIVQGLARAPMRSLLGHMLTAAPVLDRTMRMGRVAGGVSGWGDGDGSGRLQRHRRGWCSWFAPRKGLYVYNDRGATAAAASRKVLSRVAAAARRNVAAQREAARRRGEYDSGEEGEEGGGPGRRSGGSRYASSYDLATYSQGLLSTTAQALDEGRGPLGSEAAFARNGSGPAFLTPQARRTRGTSYTRAGAATTQRPSLRSNGASRLGNGRGYSAGVTTRLAARRAAGWGTSGEGPIGRALTADDIDSTQAPSLSGRAWRRPLSEVSKLATGGAVTPGRWSSLVSHRGISLSEAHTHGDPIANRAPTEGDEYDDEGLYPRGQRGRGRGNGAAGNASGNGTGSSEGVSRVTRFGLGFAGEAGVGLSRASRGDSEDDTGGLGAEQGDGASGSGAEDDAAGGGATAWADYVTAIDNDVSTSAWEELFDRWRLRAEVTERALYAGHCRFDGRSPLPGCGDTLHQGLATDLGRLQALLAVRDIGRHDSEARQEVFAESTGQLWLDLLWCLTGTIDALTLSLQVVSVRGVAPAAAVFKPRQAIRGGGRLLELRSFNPVYEQAKWLTGRPAIPSERPLAVWTRYRATARFQDSSHDVTAMDELLSGSGGEGSAGVGGRREGGAGGLNDYYSDGTGSVDDDAALASVAGLFAGASAGVGGEAQQASMQSKRSALHVIRQQNRNRRSGPGGGSGSGGVPSLMRRAFKRSPRDVTAALFVDAAGVMAAADALSSFACAAPEEDDFGVVQHSLPTLVCSLAACLLAVEDYVASPAFTGSFAPPPKLEGNAVVRPQPAAVTFVLERALYRLTNCYGSALTRSGHVQLPARVATRLAAFFEFHE